MSSFNFLDNNNKKYEDLLDAKDVFLTSDLHFFKCLKDDICDKKHIDEYSECIKNINKYVNKNDYLLILGDLFYKNIDVNNEMHLNCLKKGIELYKNIKCKKLMVLGNHDIIFNENIFYKMGFEVVSKYLIAKEKNIIFTHVPHDVEKDKYFNIHGHIHGSKNYYGMKSDNHFDVYYKLWNKPLRISEVLEYYMNGLYVATEELNRPTTESQIFDKNYNYTTSSINEK